MRYISFFLIVIFCLTCFTTTIQAQDKYLPFMGGQKWTCTQGNFDDPQAPNITHVYRPVAIDGQRASVSMKYAWDFGPSGGCSGNPIVATWAGEVVYVYYDTRNNFNGGWGNTVIIKNKNGRCVKQHHLQAVFVKMGEVVDQSQVIGLCGNTGVSIASSNSSDGSHAHIQEDDTCGLNDQSIQSSFADVSTDNGVPKEDKSYRSGNTFLFDQKYQSLGGPAFFGDMLPDHTDPGNPTGIHWYYPFNSSDKRNAYILDYAGNPYRCGSSMPAALVYDALNGARNVYSLICGFAKWWFDNGGPKSILGMPIGDEYVWGSGFRQDFQSGYLVWTPAYLDTNFLIRVFLRICINIPPPLLRGRLGGGSRTGTKFIF